MDQFQLSPWSGKQLKEARASKRRANASQFNRRPEAEWHFKLLDKATAIFRRYGFNTLQLYSGPASGPHAGEVFRIKEGLFEGDSLDPWTYPALA